MAERLVDHLIIGGGIAGASCAGELRRLHAGGSIMIVSRELDPPYHRPPASKDYLVGRHDRADAYIRPAEWYVSAGVELLTRTSVLALDPVERTVKLSSKEVIEYRTALIATGAMVRRLQVEGAQREGIHYLRALGNADAIRAEAHPGRRAVCVGGSYIGCEVAASLAQSGLGCTVVMLEDEPMQRGFGRDVGRYVRAQLESRGVDVIGGVEVSHFTGEDRVTGLGLLDGRELPADLVVCGTGATPDVVLARRAGLDIGERGGVVCDRRLESRFEGLYVAGDMCEYDSILHEGRARIEHERVAQTQGEHVARNMLGADAEYDEVPYFWTDLGDWATLEYTGLGGAWDRELVRGDLASGSFAVDYMSNGRLVGVLSANSHDDPAEAAARIRNTNHIGAVRPEPTRLVDVPAIG